MPAGGLLQLVSPGQANIMLNGNPSKTFWKTKYAKYTNFGLQKFRLDFTGTQQLNLTTESTFTFKVGRYADLLMDTYIVLTLPTIWSPIFPPQAVSQADGTTAYTSWAPYEFQWIDYLGALIVREIELICGNQTLQRYSGHYLLAAAQRDFGGKKLSLFYDMIGHVAELNDPGNAGARVNAYPNAYYDENPAGPQPSISARQIYIPLNAWFMNMTQQSFPLVSSQYNELNIRVTFRPIQEWFTIRDVMDPGNGFPRVAPNFNQYYMQFYRFLQPPPDETLGPTSYVTTNTTWKYDLHLNATYCFLSNAEREMFARNSQRYLMRTVHQLEFNNITGNNTVNLGSIGLVQSWMFFFRRSDANLRNQWTNYTNWPYLTQPVDVVPAPTVGNVSNPDPDGLTATLGPGVEPNGEMSGLYITQTYTPANLKTILVQLAVLLDGQERETNQQEQVYNWVEKYLRTAGYAPDGLYCYNFCLSTSPFNYQPSGAMNMSRFTDIQFQFTTISPPYNPYAQTSVICNPESGEIVGINKPTWQIFAYNYDLVVFEERVNAVVFMSGNAGLEYAY